MISQSMYRTWRKRGYLREGNSNSSKGSLMMVFRSVSLSKMMTEQKKPTKISHNLITHALTTFMCHGGFLYHDEA